MGFPWNVLTSSLKYLYAWKSNSGVESGHLRCFILNWRKVKFNQTYLLSICVRLECDVPVVVVRKLDTYHLWTIFVFKQWLNFLWDWDNESVFQFPKMSQLFLNMSTTWQYLYRCGFRDLSQDDDASFVIRSNLFTFLIHLYHWRSWKDHFKYKYRQSCHISNSFTKYHAHPFTYISTHPEWAPCLWWEPLCPPCWL